MKKINVLKNNSSKFYFTSFLVYNNLFFLGDSNGNIGIYDINTLRVLEKVKLNEKIITKMKEDVVNENTTFLIVICNYTDISIHNCQNNFEELLLTLPQINIKIQDIFVSDFIEDNNKYYYLFIAYENGIIKVIDCKDFNINNNFTINLNVCENQIYNNIYKNYEIRFINDLFKNTKLKATIIIMTSKYVNIFKWKPLFPILSKTTSILKPNIEDKLITKEMVDPNFFPIYEIFECPICIEFSKDSIQCHKCEQIFCKKCINEWKKNNRNQACPNCKGQIIEDKVNRNLMYIKDFMRIKCLYNCGNYYPLKEMNKHFENCSNCSIKKMIIFYCSFCDFKGNKSEISNHLKKCKELSSSMHVWMNSKN